MTTEEIGLYELTCKSLWIQSMLSETEQSEGLDSSHGSCNTCEVLGKYMSLDFLISNKFPLFY